MRPEPEESTKRLSPASYLQHLAQHGFVQRIGVQTCWLLSVLATSQLIRTVKTEIHGYDSSLAMQSGLTLDEFYRCRDRAVEENVLSFVPGGRPGLAIYRLRFSNTAEGGAS